MSVCVCDSVWLSGSFIGTLSKIKCPTNCVDLVDRLGLSEDQPLLILSTGGDLLTENSSMLSQHSNTDQVKVFFFHVNVTQPSHD